MSIVKRLNNLFKLQDAGKLLANSFSEITMHKDSESLPVRELYELRFTAGESLAKTFLLITRHKDS